MENVGQIVDSIIQTTLNSFDFIYCLIVNILTYSIIKIIVESKNKDIKTWVKRLILLGCILSTGVVYWAIGKNLELLINSAILAPVAWSFVFKPICKKLGIDYKDIDNVINK